MTLEHESQTETLQNDTLAGQPRPPQWCHSWELVLPLEQTGICSGVAAVEFRGKIHAFFIAGEQSSALSLRWLVLGKNNEGKLVIELKHTFPYDAVIPHRPSVTVYNDHLFCFLTGTDQRVRYQVFSGGQWSHPTVVPGVLINESPSVTSHGDKLYLAVQGAEDNAFYHKVYENFEWGPTIKHPDIYLNGSPSLCVFDNIVHMAINGTNDALYIYKFHNQKWERLYKCPYYKTQGSPSLSINNNFLVSATKRNPLRHYVTQTLMGSNTLPMPPTPITHIDETIGSYLSSPCLISYEGQFYLMGRRPCNDLGISVYRPKCP